MIKTDQMKEKDRGEAESVVNEDRKHAIEAAIVRTMKMRKVMMHNQLVLEVINQLNALFKPDPRVIRKRIEDLIVREYLERDKDDMQVCHHVIIRGAQLSTIVALHPKFLRTTYCCLNPASVRALVVQKFRYLA